MKVLELIGGLACLGMLIVWLKWMLTPSSSAAWPRQVYLRVTLLYIIPLFLLVLSGLGINAFAESLGAPEEFGLIVVGIPALLIPIGVVMILFHLWGMPMPPFLVPRWIREQDRALRRRQREARQRRWQDPEVEKAEIWANVSGVLIGVGILAVVVVFVVFGLMSDSHQH